MTMAKGRCEFEPMAWDMGAGSRPSMVIVMGQSRRVAPSIAASGDIAYADRPALRCTAGYTKWAIDNHSAIA
jgi:hypothetical protein